MQLEEMKGNCEFPAIPNGQSEHQASDLAAIRLQIELSPGLASKSSFPAHLFLIQGSGSGSDGPQHPLGWAHLQEGVWGFFILLNQACRAIEK